MGHYRGHLKSLLLIACGCLLAGNAFAVNWEGSLLFAPSLVYTDNVCLSNEDKKDDWTGVGVMTPSGTASMESSRTRLTVTGSVSVNTLTNGDLRDDGCTGNALNDRQRWFPRIFASLNTTLITGWVKLDANVRADQNSVSSALANSNDELNRNGNTNTFYRYSISPYTSRKLGPRTSVNARYTYSEVINTADEVADSDRHALNANVRGKVGTVLDWNLRGNYSRTGYQDDVLNLRTGEFAPREDTELRSLSLNLGYQIIRTLKFTGTYGWEWNDFETFGNNDTGGGAWDIGLAWTPSPRTSVSVGSGDRFFGSTPRVNFKHSYKRHTITGNYRKTITFQRDLSTYGLDSFGEDPGGSQFGDPLFSGGDTRFDSNGDPVDGIGTNTSVNSNSAILDERFTFRYSYSGRPGRLTFFGSYSEQTRAEDGAQADFGEWELTFTPNLSKRYSVIGIIEYEDVRPAGFIQFDDNNDPRDFSDVENWHYRLQYVRPLNTRMTSILEYRFTDRKSDDPINEYDENLFRATLNISL
jgi:uncharacterized protein (PEP-CTERM system associated)